MRECGGLANRQTGRRENIDGGLDGCVGSDHSEPPDRRECAAIDTKSRVASHSPIRGGGGKVR